MRIIQAENDVLCIGYCGENLATRVVFPVGDWIESFGEGAFNLLIKRPGEDEEPYFALTERSGDELSWNVTNADTAIPGDGKCMLQYFVDDTLVMSSVYRLRIFESLGTESSDVPDGQKLWYEELIKKSDTVIKNIESAAASATSAQGYANDANSSASNAAASATSAQGYANNASSSASGAAASAASAQGYANDASSSATNASASAASAQGYANDASSSATNAATSAASAQGYANDASSSATSAADSAASAQGYANTASSSASGAAASATSAQGYANDANSSATGAAASAASAQGYANDANSSATGAAASAASAQGYASDASSSASSASASAAAAESAAQLVQADNGNVRHYGARWSKKQHQMTRLYDAENISTDTTNFAYRGSKNASYDNPFDSIYPWSGIKLCNIDIARYRKLKKGDSLTDCVVAWEGDKAFSYTHANGVWRYCPEFYGKCWDESAGRCFDVADRPIGGYHRYRERIIGRWYGKTVVGTVDGEQKNLFLPTQGIPCTDIAASAMHAQANNYGASLDSVFSSDADRLLMIVEYASMNAQLAIGKGPSQVTRFQGDKLAAACENSTVIKVSRSAASACIPGAILVISTEQSNADIGKFTIVSVADDSGDDTLSDVTLSAAVTANTNHYWSIRGVADVADNTLGSKSGYIGNEGQCNVYYRGALLYGSMWLYTLGAYRQSGGRRVWLANSEAEADACDAVNSSVHYDTALNLPSASGAINAMHILNRSGLLCAAPIMSAKTTLSDNPVGDSQYVPASSAGATVLFLGGSTGDDNGIFSASWLKDATVSDYAYSARPVLMTPTAY